MSILLNTYCQILFEKEFQNNNLYNNDVVNFVLILRRRKKYAYGKGLKFLDLEGMGQF